MGPEVEEAAEVGEVVGEEEMMEGQSATAVTGWGTLPGSARREMEMMEEAVEEEGIEIMEGADLNVTSVTDLDILLGSAGRKRIVATSVMAPGILQEIVVRTRTHATTATRSGIL